MAYTIEQVIELCETYCDKANVSLVVPVKANGRLKSTLGRVKYHTSFDRCIPDIIEFSKMLLEEGTDEEIVSVIAHECAHYIVTVKTGEKHGHDAVFKQMCSFLGTDNNKAHTEISYSTRRNPKYTVYCEDCDFSDGYYRMCNTLKYLQMGLCRCPDCKSNRLAMIQNY